MEQEEALNTVDFFQSRRGRTKSFFLIDQEQLWTATAAGGSVFVDIDPLGDFDNFSEELDYLGIVLQDGTSYVREVVTIQAILGIWRLTLAEALPAFALSQIRRLTRARIVRFDSDAMREVWLTDNVMNTNLGFIECLEEKDVEL